jgi:prepilin-type N-terminal cleavage/methylation domain-containing protein
VQCPRVAMAGRKGFTLIETLITTLVLVTGLAAVAGLFSYAAQTNAQNRQRTAAVALLNRRMEELRSGPKLATGQLTEYLAILPDGSVAKYGNNQGMYKLITLIEAGTPQRVTVSLYARQLHRGNSYQELARAVVLLGRRF